MNRPSTIRRKKAPRFAEIAEAAGVSPATVDRVLNERDSVSAATRDRVLTAARALGIRRLLPDAHRPLVHLDILLPRNDSPFFRRIRAAFNEATALFDGRVIIHRHTLPEVDTARLVRAILDPGYTRAGMILSAPDDPQVRAALEAVLTTGQKVVTIVTDLPGLAGVDYCGPDNWRAGATAAYLMGRITPAPGRVILLSGRRDYRGHTDRLGGFRSVIARDFGHLTCDLADADTHDDAERCYRALKTALAAGSVVGVYNTGAGSDGVARALASLMPRPTWISHEVSDDHIVLLQDRRMDMVIDQNPAGQATAALQTLLFRCGLIESPPRDEAAELRIYTAENLPRKAYAQR